MEKCVRVCGEVHFLAKTRLVCKKKKKSFLSRKRPSWKRTHMWICNLSSGLLVKHGELWPLALNLKSNNQQCSKRNTLNQICGMWTKGKPYITLSLKSRPSNPDSSVLCHRPASCDTLSHLPSDKILPLEILWKDSVHEQWKLLNRKVKFQCICSNNVHVQFRNHLNAASMITQFKGARLPSETSSRFWEMITPFKWKQRSNRMTVLTLYSAVWLFQMVLSYLTSHKSP